MATERERRLANKLAEWRSRFQREVGERLKEERRRLGMSKVEFAKRVGVHRNTQTNYESGEREPDADYLEAAEKLGVSLSYILDGERVDGLPRFAAHLAHQIFLKSGALCSIDAVAMEELFFLLGLDETNKLSGSNQVMDEEQRDALIREAFQRGDVFAETAKAISNYALRICEEPSPKMLASLILQTIEYYDAASDKLHLSLRDNIRLVADDVVEQARNTR